MAKYNPGAEVARVITRWPEIDGILREEVSIRADGQRLARSVKLAASGVNHDTGWRVVPGRVFIGALPAIVGQYRNERLPEGASREVLMS